MSDFCKFNDIYNRAALLSESVSKEFPGLKAPWKKAAADARKAGASAPTREAKMTVLRIVVGLIANRIGRELSAEEERSIMKFRNIASQSPLVDFLKSQEIDGQSYAAIIGNSTEQDIQAASERSGIADDVQFQIGQRSDQRKEAYKDRAAAREEAQKMADAAEEGGDAELGNSLDEIGDYIVRFAKGVSEVEKEPLPFDDVDIELHDVDNKDVVVNKLVEFLSGAGYTVEATPSGVNIEGPVGAFGDQDKAEDLVKGLVMKLFPNVGENQINVLLNTDAAIEDQETPMRSEDGEEHKDEVVVGAMILVNGEWYAVDAIDHEVSTVVYASNKDGAEFEFTLDDIEAVDASSVEIFTDPPTENAEETVTESYTSMWMVDQRASDKRNVKPIVESVSFKERFKPKTLNQLEELRRYGL